MAPKNKLHRHGPYAMFTQSWDFQFSSWSGSKTRPGIVPKYRHSIDTGFMPCWLSLEHFSGLAGMKVKLVKQCPIMVLTFSPWILRQLIDMGLRPCWLSFRNFNAIAGFKVQLGQTWSRHRPQNRHSIVMGLRQYWLSLESISNLAGLEFNLDSTCFKNGPKMVPKKYTLQRHWPYTMLTQSWTFQCSSSSRSNVRTNMVPTWSWYGPWKETP